MLDNKRHFTCGNSLVRILPKSHMQLLGIVIVVGRAVLSCDRIAWNEALGSSNQISLSRNILNMRIMDKNKIIMWNVVEYSIQGNTQKLTQKIKMNLFWLLILINTIKLWLWLYFSFWQKLFLMYSLGNRTKSHDNIKI